MSEKGTCVRRTRFLVSSAMAVICAAVVVDRGIAGTTYAIDPSQSHLQVTLLSAGVAVGLPQNAGSDATGLSGTLNATVGAGNITLANTSNILFANQATVQKPGPGGGVASPGAPADGNPSPPGVPLPDNPGSGVANYGFTLIVPSDPGDPLNLATAALAGYADIRAALGTLSGTSTITGGAFDAGALSFATTAGSFDYNVNNGAGDGSPSNLGSTSMVGSSGANVGAGNGSLLGSVLTIPINVDLAISAGLITVDAIFTGQIRAVAAVPEPSTAALAGWGLLGLLAAIRRWLRSA